MATQKRPLPATDIAKAETDRTLSDIFDDPYVLRAFENLIPGGGGGLSSYPKTWVLVAADGDFATLAEVEASSDVVNGDNIMIIGTVTTGGLTNLTKSLNFFLYPNALFSLPATVSAANTYVSGSMSASNTVTSGPALSIENTTVSGNLFLSNIKVIRSAISARTLTVTGATFSLSGITWTTANLTVSSGTFTTINNTTMLSGTINIASTTLYAINSYIATLTRSGGTTLLIVNSRFGTNLLISAAAQQFTITNSSVGSTLTLPATITAGSKLRHVNATTITAPNAVVVDSSLGSYGTKNANVSFLDALINVVGAAFV